MGKEVGRDLSPSLHHFVGRDRETKCLFVKLDGEPVTHAQNVSVVFAAIGNAVFDKQLRVNLVPPRLGVGENVVQIEDYSAKRLRHDKGIIARSRGQLMLMLMLVIVIVIELRDQRSERLINEKP